MVTVQQGELHEKKKKNTGISLRSKKPALKFFGGGAKQGRGGRGRKFVTGATSRPSAYKERRGAAGACTSLRDQRVPIYIRKITLETRPMSVRKTPIRKKKTKKNQTGGKCSFSTLFHQQVCLELKKVPHASVMCLPLLWFNSGF